MKRNGICYNPFHGRARFRERAGSRIHGKSEPAAPEEPVQSQTHGCTAKGEIITKGDANKENDFLPVKYEKVIGVVVNCIPEAGFAAGLARDMKGIILIVSMIGAGFALLIAATYMKK